MRSMTGLGRCQMQTEAWEVTVELKSVNHRFLDVALRLPRNLSFLEECIRKGLAAGMKRGHVDVFVTVRSLANGASEVSVDELLAKSYYDAAKRLAEATGAPMTLGMAELMRMEGVTQVTESAMDEEAVGALCAQAVAGAVKQLDDMRLREGVNLRSDLAEHLEKAAVLREQIAVRAPGVVEDYRARLANRLAQLPVEPVDPARLAQEVALMADKCAIDEELSRLDSHIGQMRGYLDAKGEVGKKMDFLIQEMNREANTIGSKASDTLIAQCVVDLKSEIEKLREQIQNAE